MALIESNYAERYALMPAHKKDEFKKDLKRLVSDMEKLTPAEARSRLERQEKQKIYEQEREGWKLTPHEVQLRVKEIREHLENFNDMISALRFDIIEPDTPFSLHGRDNDMESSALAERLNPSIAGRYKRLQDRLYELDEDVIADDYLGPLKWDLADTAFAIGVLAGAIYTGAPEREIDKLERGLLHATLARPNEIKE